MVLIASVDNMKKPKAIYSFFSYAYQIGFLLMVLYFAIQGIADCVRWCEQF